MNLIKAIIVEDDIEQTNCTKLFLENYAKENKQILFDIHIYHSPIEFIETYEYDADLLFLDIRMPGMSGMEVAKEIRKKDDSVTIIFITSLAQYAIEGYSVGAEDYILKPIQYEEFKIKMTRILSHISLRSSKYLTFITEESISKVSIDNIMYIETDIHRLIFHDNEGFTYIRHQSMKQCEEEFKNTDFFRINSSFLVNFRYANRIENSDMILIDGSKLKISRPRLRQVIDRFTKMNTR